ncbi:helix-turn-helix transcriptional regulator [Verrucomicrobiaceae bacterium N1E253]|uniref:Helix-turn-helix transcriptional regulator n=1 Tax=Oceaniferula marina TaxID=2748318 RepID=A0A851GFZ4_9BACT|nr:metalloregulator ArsR/SmtB family transcription factor [Oceaniferula marina]NWK56698.1 helix-turn-helix transcriptional regulator [Oceaniferula marina]
MTQDQLDAIKRQFEDNQLVCEKVVGLFHLFSNKVRFRTVCMLMYGEACVQEIAEVVTAGKMTNISQQLRVLRLAGVVKQRRNKKQMLYSLADPKIARMIEYLRCEFLEDCNPTTENDQ